MLTGPIIRTRYIGPTDRRGSRVIADHRRDSETVLRVTIPWDHAASSEKNHELAARILADRFSQPMKLAGRGHDDSAYWWLAVAADSQL